MGMIIKKMLKGVNSTDWCYWCLQVRYQFAALKRQKETEKGREGEKETDLIWKNSSCLVELALNTLLTVKLTAVLHDKV